MAAHNSDQFGAAVPRPGAGPAGDLKVLFGTIEFASAPSASDTINLFTIPAGFTPLFGYLQGDDIDTGTETLDIDVGTSDDADYFGNLGVLTGDAVTDIKPEASIWLPLGNLIRINKPTEITTDTDCIATINAAAAAGGTGTLTVIMCGVFQDARVSA